MRTTLLDALPRGPIATAVGSVLEEDTELAAVHRLADATFAPCQGCFECWVEHPGTCRAQDAANGVMRDVMAADVVVWTTRTRFAAWDPIAKVALDKSIGIISPFFTTAGGETHHHKRYLEYPRWGVLAVHDGTDEEKARFRLLVERNAINLHAHAPWVGFVAPNATPEEVRSVVAGGLRALRSEDELDLPVVEPFPARDDADGPRVRARGARDGSAPHLVSWIGSAKATGQSASERLAAALERRLAERGWTTERVHVLRTVKLGRSGSPALVDAARRADLFVVAAPVYVDSLPSLVVAGLSHLVDAGLDAHGPTILPIVQCGFPELSHTALAVELVWRASRAAGWRWAGHLALGGGGTVGGDLDAAGGKHRAQCEALDAAADALDAGEPVPAEAITGFATPVMPPSLYRIAGQVGWIAQAVRSGTNPLRLLARPFERSD